jgi:ribose 5-phosphate isomerase B
MIGSGNADMGILVCGTGIGMSIVANKHKGIRASNVESVAAAKFARSHNNCNILAIGARITPWEEVEKIVKVFLTTPFEGGRHQRRVDKIHSLTNL